MDVASFRRRFRETGVGRILFKLTAESIRVPAAPEDIFSTNELDLVANIEHTSTLSPPDTLPFRMPANDRFRRGLESTPTAGYVGAAPHARSRGRPVRCKIHPDFNFSSPMASVGGNFHSQR